MKLVFRKSFWNDCSEPDRQNHFLTFLSFSVEGSGDEPNKKLKRKWFWSGGRRSACLPKRQRRQDSGGDGAVELFRPSLADEKIAQALLAPLFNYKSLRDFFLKKVRAKDKISPPIKTSCAESAPCLRAFSARSFNLRKGWDSPGIRRAPRACGANPVDGLRKLIFVSSGRGGIRSKHSKIFF